MSMPESEIVELSTFLEENPGECPQKAWDRSFPTNVFDFVATEREEEKVTPDIGAQEGSEIDYLGTAAEALFEHRFRLEGEPSAAQLLFTCDDACTIKINGGKAIEKKSLWMEPKVVQITNLKEGENHIEISATNDGPSPAGLLISLAVREDEGRVKHIVSSSAWSAKVAGAKWKPAADLGKYGSAPWGEKIQEKVAQM